MMLHYMYMQSCRHVPLHQQQNLFLPHGPHQAPHLSYPQPYLYSPLLNLIFTKYKTKTNTNTSLSNPNPPPNSNSPPLLRRVLPLRSDPPHPRPAYQSLKHKNPKSPSCQNQIFPILPPPNSSTPMDFNGHKNSPSTDRFLSVFSPPPQPKSPILNGSSRADSSADELNEDEVFWTGDFAQNKFKRNQSSKLSPFSRFGNRSGLRKGEERSGIWAALTEESTKGQSLIRKPSFSPTAARNSVLAIPRPPSERELGKMGGGSAEEGEGKEKVKFQNSAPVNVPILSREMMVMRANVRRNKAFFEAVADDDGEDDGEDEMLPPHEIVARGSALTPKTTFSVLEGVGRTLKGRDLRQVRNAVFRQTGFLD